MERKNPQRVSVMPMSIFCSLLFNFSFLLLQRSVTKKIKYWRHKFRWKKKALCAHSYWSNCSTTKNIVDKKILLRVQSFVENPKITSHNVKKKIAKKSGIFFGFWHLSSRGFLREWGGNCENYYKKLLLRGRKSFYTWGGDKKIPLIYWHFPNFVRRYLPSPNFEFEWLKNSGNKQHYTMQWSKQHQQHI